MIYLLYWKSIDLHILFNIVAIDSVEYNNEITKS